MMKTDIATETETRPAPAITREDRVIHAYPAPNGTISPGTTSFCGLHRWDGPVVWSTDAPPANACSVCDGMLRGGSR